MRFRPPPMDFPEENDVDVEIVLDEDADGLPRVVDMMELEKETRRTWLRRLRGTAIRKRDMDDLIMNFLLVEGYVEAAEIFQQELGFEFVDASILERLTSIKNCIIRGQASEAINRVNEWMPEVLESSVSVHAGLIKQNVFELLSSNNAPGALDYAREALVPLIEKDEKNLMWAESTMMMFLYEDMVRSPYVSLVNRMGIARDVIRSILPSVGRDNESKLPRFMKMLKYVQWAGWFPKIIDFSRPFVFDRRVLNI